MNTTLKKYLLLFADALLAGFLIGIGSLVYLRTSDKIVGAFVFSIGLLGVIFFKAKLYTGAIGYAKWQDALDILLIFIGNTIGIAYCGLYGIDASEMFAAKLLSPLPLVFLKGIVCGALIFFAVSYSKAADRVSSTLITVMCVAAFILCGSEHSIADIGYLFAAKSFTWKSILFILVVALGNWVGAKIVYVITERFRQTGK